MAKTQGKPKKDVLDEITEKVNGLKTKPVPSIAKKRSLSPPAPLGNEYAVGNHGGRPTSYRPEYCDQIIELFSRPPTKTRVKTIRTAKGAEITEEVEVPEKLPTLIEFAHSIGVNKDTLYEWAKHHVAFSVALTRAREKAETFLVQNGLLGLYPPKSFIFVAQNYTGLRDKVEHTGEGGGPISVQIVNFGGQKGGDPKSPAR